MSEPSYGRAPAPAHPGPPRLACQPRGRDPGPAVEGRAPSQRQQASGPRGSWPPTAAPQRPPVRSPQHCWPCPMGPETWPRPSSSFLIWVQSQPSKASGPPSAEAGVPLRRGGQARQRGRKSGAGQLGRAGEPARAGDSAGRGPLATAPGPAWGDFPFNCRFQGSSCCQWPRWWGPPGLSPPSLDTPHTQPCGPYTPSDPECGPRHPRSSQGPQGPAPSHHSLVTPEFWSSHCTFILKDGVTRGGRRLLAVSNGAP